MVIALSGDRGLCGGYNNFIIKKVCKEQDQDSICRPAHCSLAGLFYSRAAARQQAGAVPAAEYSWPDQSQQPIQDNALAAQAVLLSLGRFTFLVSLVIGIPCQAACVACFALARLAAGVLRTQTGTGYL
jgi:hypothetical protein